MSGWSRVFLPVFFEIILFAYILIIGTGIRWHFWTDMGMVVGMILLLIAGLETGRTKVPPSYLLYLVFVGALSTNVLQMGDIFNSPKYMAIYVSMGLVWLASYNMSIAAGSRDLKKDIEMFVVGAGIIFALLANWLNSFIEFVPKGMMQFGMVASYTATHHHLAIWWSMSALILIKWFSERKWDKRVLNLLSLTTIVVLVVSRTRSAVVGLLVGWVFTAVKKKKIKISQLGGGIVCGLLVVIFLGWNKSWLAVLVYGWQGMVAWLAKPSGYGMGNYFSVSTNFFPYWGGNTYQTAFAHNAVIEMLVGIGYWGIVYLIWLISVVMQIIKLKSDETLYKSIFLLLITTTMLDVSYAIPSLVWMMGLSLGLAQGEKKAKRGEFAK